MVDTLVRNVDRHHHPPQLKKKAERWSGCP
jgi:hypothetical protein